MLAPTRFAYHVTDASRLSAIARVGLLPVATAGIGPMASQTAYAGAEGAAVYFCDHDGIGFWLEQAKKDGAEKPIVLAFAWPKEAERDEVGCAQSGAEAWLTRKVVGPEKILRWEAGKYRALLA